VRDMDLVSGRFLQLDLPPEKRYLLLYFTTEVQVAFVKYYLVFGDVENFMDHTGHHCSDRWVRKMRERLERLMSLHARVKKDLTEENLKTLAAIEGGRFKVGEVR
jgi:hypothetical protein